MKKIYKKITTSLYLYYCTFMFGAIYFLFHIFFFEPLIHLKKYRYLTSTFNRIWAKITFFFWQLPYEVIHEDSTEKRKSVVYASNHFSFFDIPLLCHLPRSFAFVGKIQIAKAPLFGRMFKYLHIAFDRKKRRGGIFAYTESLKILDDNRSVLFFPEGGIVYKKLPEMAMLKDGAFRLAIESQKPLIPVSVINSAYVMPVKHRLEFYYCPVKIFIHSAIETKGKTANDLPEIKATYKQKVQETLNRYYGNH